MRENYVVARVGRYSRGDAKGVQIHNDRKNENHMNPDIFPERSHLNMELVPTKGDELYTELFDKMVAADQIRTTGLKGDAVIFNEILHDVNSEYWLSYKEHGFKSPEEFATAYFMDCLRFDRMIYGSDKILSAKIHYDELNRELTEKYGFQVWHYHMHVIAVPTVIKEKKWSSRCKDPALVGTVKERYLQVSDSKFWASEKGHENSYTKFQNDIFDFLSPKYPDLQRGEKGSKAKNLKSEDYKAVKDEMRELRKENEKVKEDNKRLNQENQKLQEENEMLKKTNSESSGEAESLQAQCQELQKTVDQCNNEIQALLLQQQLLQEQNRQVAEEIELKRKAAGRIRQQQELEYEEFEQAKARIIADLKSVEDKIDTAFPEYVVPDDRFDFVAWCLDHIKGLFELVENICKEKYQEFKNFVEKPILNELEGIKERTLSLEEKMKGAAVISNQHNHHTKTPDRGDDRSF